MSAVLENVTEQTEVLDESLDSSDDAFDGTATSFDARRFAA